MKKIVYLFVFLILADIGMPDIGSSCLRTIEVPIVATTPDLSQGIVGKIKLELLEGKGFTIDYSTNVDMTTYNSAVDAISFAEKYTNKTANYLLTYELPAYSVSGGSTGAAVALAAIALLENKSIVNTSLITGGIDSNGELIQTGAIPLKIKAAESRFKQMFIPNGQTRLIVYEKTAKFSNGYIVRQVDLQEYTNLSLSEVKNLKEAIPYMIK